jgi:hypothetical protein
MRSMLSVGDPAQPFTLEDQFGTATAVTFGAGHPVVVIFADRSCTDEVAPWAQRVSDELGAQARVVGVAALGIVPPIFHGVVRGFLHDKPSVLLDWGNRVSDAFDYAGGGCLVVAVDGMGTVRARVLGPMTDARYEQLDAAVHGR